MTAGSSLQKILYSTLCSVSKELLALKPWKYIRPDGIFAVRDPDSDRMVFVSISGEDEETFRLIACRGFNGLDALWSYLNSGLKYPPPDFLCNLDAMSIENRMSTELTLTELDNMPLDGLDSLTFCFRKLIPGYCSSLLNISEMCFLIHIVRQSFNVVERVKMNSLSLDVSEGHEDDYLVRVPQKCGNLINWVDCTESYALDSLLPLPVPFFTDEQIAMLNSLPVSIKQLYLNLFVILPKEDSGSPCPVKVIFSAASGRLDGLECVCGVVPKGTLSPFIDSLSALIIEVLRKRGSRPSKVIVNTNSLLERLCMLPEVCSIPVSVSQASQKIQDTQAEVLSQSLSAGDALLKPETVWF